MRSLLVAPLEISGWSASVRTSTSAGSRCDMRPPWQPAVGDRIPSRQVPKTVRRPVVVRHPAAMIGRWRRVPTGGTADAVPVSPAAGRGPEHRVAALTLAALLFVGGLMGTLNLFVDGVLRDGATALDLRRGDAAVHGRRGAAGRAAAGRPVADVRAGPARRPDLPRRRPVHRGPGPLRHPAACCCSPPSSPPGSSGRGSSDVNMVVTAVVCAWPCGPATTAPSPLGIQVGVSAGTLNARRAGGVRAPAARAAAARRDPGAVPPRPADRAVQPPVPDRAGAAHLASGPPRRHPRGRDGARHRPLQAAQRRARARRRRRRPLRGRPGAGGDGPAGRRPRPHRRRGTRRPRPGRRPRRGAAAGRAPAPRGRAQPHRRTATR